MPIIKPGISTSKILDLTIRPLEEIVEELFTTKQSIRRFPKSLDFPFGELYADVVTQIRTIEISAECILFDSVEALNNTTTFSDKDYWEEDYSKQEIAAFWIFGENGKGDLWLFDRAKSVYFYDHDQEQMCRDNFVDLNLSFEKWLQYADLNKQLDHLYDSQSVVSEEQKAEYKVRLSELSSSLLDKYPFSI